MSAVRRFIGLQLLILALLSAALFFVPVQFASAVESLEEICKCYCSTSVGALTIGPRSVSDCRLVCDSVKGGLYLGCYTEQQKDLWPENNNLCWSKTGCESDIVLIDKKEVNSVWGNSQVPNCISGKRYCYNPPVPVTLSVAIGDLTEAGTIGEYVSAVYRWLIPAAAILAIVVLMIGGMQYALARGRPEAISKAKTRMSNALIGLLLVVGAYTIASIIDPNLVTFKELGVPKIRTVVFLDASSTCEFMEENKLIIEPKEGSEEKKCGDKGTVESIPEEAGVTIQEGDPCTYSFCTKTSEKCVSSTLAEKGFDCIRCAESYTTSTGTTNPKGLTPTPTNCARLLHKATEEEKEEEKFFYCEFDAVVFNQCFEIAYPFSASRFFERADSLDCKRLRQDAEVAGSESCRAYDWVKGVYGAFTASGVTANEVDDIIGEKRGDYPLLKKICEEDPCGLAPPGKSCQVFFVSGDEEASIAVGALCTAATFFTGPVALAFGGACALGASAVLSYTGLLSQANCADQDSNYGFFDCTDKNGDPTVCNPYPLLW